MQKPKDYSKGNIYEPDLVSGYNQYDSRPELEPREIRAGGTSDRMKHSRGKSDEDKLPDL